MPIGAAKNQLLKGRPKLEQTQLKPSAGALTVLNDVLEATYTEETSIFRNLSDGDVMARNGGVVSKSFTLTIRTLDAYGATQTFPAGTAISGAGVLADCISVQFEAEGTAAASPLTTITLQNAASAVGKVTSVTSGGGDRGEYVINIKLYSADGSTSPLTLTAA